MKVSRLVLTLPIALPFLTSGQAAATPDASPFADPEVAEPIGEVVYEGVTYKYTAADRTSMQMNRALFGVASDTATVDALLERFDGKSVVYTNGAVFTAEEAEQVLLQMSYGETLGDINPELAEFDSFGGSWIDHRNGGTVSIAVTDRGTDVEAFASKSLVGVPVSFVVVDTSYKQLLSLYEQLNELVGDGTLKADIAVIQRTNAIEITAPQLSLDLARSIVDSVTSDVRVDYVADGRLGDEINIIAGAGLAFLMNGRTECSIGPTLIRLSNNERVFTTAGHCDTGSPDQDWYRGSNLIGRTLSTSDGLSVDAAMVRVDPGDYATDDIHSFDNQGGVAGTKDVIGTSSGAEGQQICESQGSSIMTRCGPITSMSANISNNTNQIKATMCSQPGDSGTVVFRDFGNNQATIVGVHNGGTLNGTDCTSSDSVVLSKIASVNNSFGTIVATS